MDGLNSNTDKVKQHLSLGKTLPSAVSLVHLPCCSFQSGELALMHTRPLQAKLFT